MEKGKTRTLVQDVAKLIKANKISKADIKLLDKNLYDEAVALAGVMTEEEVVTNIEIKPIVKPKPVPPPPPPPPKPIPQPEPKKEPESKPVQKVISVPVKPVPPPPPPPPVVLEEKIVADINNLDIKIGLLNKKKEEILSEKNGLLSSLDKVRAEEKKLETDESDLSKKVESAVGLSARKTLEEKRWTIEDERQKVEKKRFEIKKSIDVVDLQVTQNQKERIHLEEEKSLLERKQEIEKAKKQGEKAKTDKQAEEKVYAGLELKKRSFETDWIKAKEGIKHIQKETENLGKQTQEIKEKIKTLEQREGNAINETDRHEAETNRWELDKQLREVEKKAWSLEEEGEKKTNEVSDLEKIFAQLQEDEMKSKKKIFEYQTLIDKAGV